ncbi:heparinase II/III family protein [Halobacillus locisalis]|uniref:Heparinase II/III family protein n=1 Tax=Halobacillus locisalis TaxID=220753 RepID=A0A838CTV7_9BACI|nr:heparinase II/III family protein [Halobacillus locisalis]MBA2175361.1 heparinase II/III family protein [Halobacillus locisalis]
MIRSLIFDFGLPWVTNRFLYSMKLKMMRGVPWTENLFEKNIEVKRLNIFKMNTEAIEGFLSSIPSRKNEQIIQAANKATNGIITGFSSIDLDYGSELNWHYHPISKVQIDNKKKWYEIPDFDPSRGDIKVVWEASRLTHFFYLARAYMLTKDMKYYQAYSRQLEDWIKNNPYSFGANYKCGQEATLRMISALIGHSVFHNYGLITDKDQKNLKELVRGSYKKVLSNFFYANKCIKNNHTLSEICGLIIGSWCCEDSSSLVRAYKMMDREISRQFSDDGGYIQNSFNYQRLALQIMECVLKLSEVTNVILSDNSKDLILKSAHQMYQMQDESGDLPNRGANDGALIFPVTSCSYRDFRSVINTINTLLSNERLYDKGLYDEEILWFSNKKLNDIPVKNLKRTSNAYFEAGIFSLRKNEDSFLMTILKNNKTRPSHMDQLHVDLWHRGINVFCDNGSYSYADPIGKNLSLTSSHNTAKVNEVEQMNKKGAFLVTDWTKSQDVSFTESSFNGTLISRNGYKHKRNIESTETGYRVSDVIYGKGIGCEFRFHTPCDVEITPIGFDLYYNGRILTSIETKGVVEVKKAYRSQQYMRKEEIKCITVKGEKLSEQYQMSFDIKLI